MGRVDAGIFALGTSSPADLERDPVADAQQSEAVARVAARGKPRTTIGVVNVRVASAVAQSLSSIPLSLSVNPRP
jgi:hypothetical protein